MNRVELKLSSVAWQDFIRILLYNGYEISCKADEENNILVVTWENRKAWEIYESGD